MDIEKYMLSLGEDAYLEDMDYLQEMLSMQQQSKDRILQLIILFWGTKKNKRKLLSTINSEIHTMFVSYSARMTEELEQRFSDNYLKTVYGIQSMSEAWKQAKTPSVFDKKWHINGGSYLDDLTYYENRLKYEVRKNLNREILLDGTAESATEAVTKPFNGLTNSSKSMIDTELTYAERQATKTACDDYDLSKYRFIVTLYTKTCETCAALDTKVFKYSEAETGVNYPPMHPHCRCVVIPYFDDFSTGTRAARNEEDISTQVPTLSYDEWYKRYAKEI